MKNPLAGLTEHFTSVPNVAKAGKLETAMMLLNPEFYKESARELVAGPWDKNRSSRVTGVTASFDIAGARKSAQRERRAAARASKPNATQRRRAGLGGSD